LVNSKRNIIYLYQRHIKDSPFVISLNVMCVGIIPIFYRLLINNIWY